MLVVLIAALLVLILLGIPVAFSLVGASLLSILSTGSLSLESLPQRMLVGLDSYALLAIPLFILAGELMNRGGITSRLIRFAQAMVGHIRGSMAHVGIVSNIFMSGVSGSAVADAAATGTTLIPEMVKRGYGRGLASAVIASAATIGPIIPPSISMILYGSVSTASIGRLFLGGVVPGILMGLGLMAVVYFKALKRGLDKNRRATWKELVDAFKGAVWALVMPLIIIGGILSGFFTPTESALVAVLYALFVGFFVYRELQWNQLREAMFSSLKTVAAICIIISAAAPFGWIMAYDQGPQKVLELFQSLSSTPWVIMLLVMIALLILGCFLEGNTIIIVTTPVILPLMIQIGVDPIHYGVILAINCIIGAITPPVGVLMYTTNSIAKATVSEFVKEAAPFIAVLVALLLLFAYVPQLVLFLPNLLMG